MAPQTPLDPKSTFFPGFTGFFKKKLMVSAYNHTALEHRVEISGGTDTVSAPRKDETLTYHAAPTTS